MLLRLRSSWWEQDSKALANGQWRRVVLNTTLNSLAQASAWAPTSCFNIFSCLQSVTAKEQGVGRTYSGCFQREQDKARRLGHGEEGAAVEECKPSLGLGCKGGRRMCVHSCRDGFVHKVSHQCRTPMEHLRRWYHPQPSPGPVWSVSCRPSIPSLGAQTTFWAVFDATSV